ncbi:hypothetical protein WN55_06629 [Dufourea novaeangliae]|uniref:Uncharacterized protein n=1 Tax=Dufourea novaeangliae TaxID=178035 RepID=A0A154PSF9_DUFNO|nr:hypothetical protein WN55_06629 [Dufourea novaeangliae]
MCGFHEALGSKVSPRILIDLACLSSEFLNCNFILSWFLYLVNVMTSDLVLENLKPDEFAHLCSLFRADRRIFCVVLIFFPLQRIVKSSAKRKALIGGIINEITSLIAIKKSVTLSTDPCGAPFWILIACDRDLLVRTFICLVFRKFTTKDKIFPWKPRLLKIVTSRFLHIKSYAFSMSEAISTVD